MFILILEKKYSHENICHYHSELLQSLAKHNSALAVEVERWWILRALHIQSGSRCTTVTKVLSSQLGDCQALPHDSKIPLSYCCIHFVVRYITTKMCHVSAIVPQGSVQSPTRFLQHIFDLITIQFDPIWSLSDNNILISSLLLCRLLFLQDPSRQRNLQIHILNKDTLHTHAVTLQE